MTAVVILNLPRTSWRDGSSIAKRVSFIKASMVSYLLLKSSSKAMTFKEDGKGLCSRRFTDVVMTRKKQTFVVDEQVRLRLRSGTTEVTVFRVRVFEGHGYIDLSSKSSTCPSLKFKYCRRSILVVV